MKKYILCPETMISKNDDDIHFIGAEKLAKLYGVKMSECIVREWDHKLGIPKRLVGIDESKYICLYPDYEGKYIRP